MNPLLLLGAPVFDQIEVHHVQPAMEIVLKEASVQIEELLDSPEMGFDTFIVPLEDHFEKLSRLWGIVGHLHSVKNTDELRDVYNQWIPTISEFYTTYSQDERYFKKIKYLKESKSFFNLSLTQQRIVLETYKGLVLSGAELNKIDKKEFQEISQRLSQLNTDFSNHVLDETQNFELILTQDEEIEGIPISILNHYHQKAIEKERGKKGENIWLVTLDAPSFLPFLKYSSHRSSREKLYKTYVSRATFGDKDNTLIMVEILQLREKKAKLLGFSSYGDLSLATKMASSVDEVIFFLEDLYERSLPQAKKEFLELEEFAQKQGLKGPIKPWDTSYYSEKLREEKYSYNEEEIRSYFPSDFVVQGLFDVVKKLYNVTFKEVVVPVWDQEVRHYGLFNEFGEEIASVYIDLYARKGKQGGAWMNSLDSRKKRKDGTIQKPVAYLICNFTPPFEGVSSLLTHREVLTLFHEMGHVLHHVLTEVNDVEASGISMVPWDGVELPSQLFENWTWQEESLAMISSHERNKKSLPLDLLNKLKEAKNFQSALGMIRQLGFGLLDMKLHQGYIPKDALDIEDYTRKIKTQYSVIKPIDEDRFENAFSHIFSGGYAAGYYSYKWAEVLSEDVFSVFEERGIFDLETSNNYKNKILSRGGSRDFVELFIDFMGRKPKVDALLKSSGIK